MTPRVNIIMPVYNGVRFIAQAINSVLAQDFQDWELMVVNDGSTDGTAEVLASFADARIRVISQANGGEAAARNRALDAINGEYVAFLDADDLYLPSALADMTAFLRVHEEFDAVRCDGYFCDESEHLLGRISEVRPEVQPGNILEELVLNPAVIGPPMLVMARHACIRKANARFDSDLVMGTDWDFWIQLARCARFGLTDRITCMYRIHQTNITKSVSARRRNADLVRGRLKVMNASWFGDLSLSTRKAFFLNLLTALLGDQPDEQRVILAAAPFEALPPTIQADLLRQVASSHLSKRQDTAFAQECLRRSLALQPNNLKGRVLHELAERSPMLAAAVLRIWQVVHRGVVSVRSLGQRKPKPVPAALLPKTE